MIRFLNAAGAIAAETVRRWITDGVFTMSAAIAYYAAFALVPGLLIVMSTVGVVYGDETTAEIAREASSLVGEDAAALVTGAVLVTRDRIGFGRRSAVLALAMMIGGASAVFAEFLNAMNTVWRVRARAGRGVLGVLRDRFWPFTLVFAIGVILLAWLLLSSFIQAYSVYVDRLVPGAAFVWPYVDLGLSVAAVTLLFALVYKFLPDARIPWSAAWLGAAVTAVFFAAGKHLFSLYLGTTAIPTVYGAAGSLFVILVWVYYSTATVLLGAEFIHVYAERRGHRVTPKRNAVAVEG